MSKRTKRPFDAFLVLDTKTGKVGFEFPPRPAKKKAAKKKN
jgi:DNA topoisomerase-3